MSDAFYSLIGAIEATVHFIATQKPDAAAAPMEFSAEGSGSPALSDESKATAYKSILNQPLLRVEDELQTLLNVKNALLNGEVALTQKLKKAIVAGSLVDGFEDVSEAERKAAWADFDTVLSGQAPIFVGALQRLQANAPEWCFLDNRLCQILHWFRVITPTGGGDPGNELSTSWGSTFGSSASSASSTSIGYVPSSYSYSSSGS